MIKRTDGGLVICYILLFGMIFCFGWAIGSSLKKVDIYPSSSGIYSKAEVGMTYVNIQPNENIYYEDGGQTGSGAVLSEFPPSSKNFEYLGDQWWEFEHHGRLFLYHDNGRRSTLTFVRIISESEPRIIKRSRRTVVEDPK